jgi:uridylate kinase
MSLKYKRILLKLSGEALMGNQNFGIDPTRLQQYAKDIKTASDAGVQIAIVIGGGNIFRGMSGVGSGIDRAQGDYMACWRLLLMAWLLKCPRKCGVIHKTVVCNQNGTNL